MKSGRVLFLRPKCTVHTLSSPLAQHYRERESVHCAFGIWASEIRPYQISTSYTLYTVGNQEIRVNNLTTDVEFICITSCYNFIYLVFHTLMSPEYNNNQPNHFAYFYIPIFPLLSTHEKVCCYSRFSGFSITVASYSTLSNLRPGSAINFL